MEVDEEAGALVTWLASFPKSGNTWARILLSNLIAPDKLNDEVLAAWSGSTSSNRASFDSISGLSSSDLTDEEIDLVRPDFYRLLSAHAIKRQFTKVHDGYHCNELGQPLFPAEISHGAIYLVRHPFDVAVSYAYHQGHDDFDKIVRQLNNGNHIMGGGTKGQLRQRTLGWSGHYRSWHEQREIPVLTIRYEDMLDDTISCLRRMVEFLAMDEHFDDRTIARAVEASRFDRLREKENSSGFRERPETTSRFFRAGRSGDGRKMLSKAQRATLFEANHVVMAELGYEP